MSIADPVFLDAGLFIGALLREDPRHDEARSIVEAARRGGYPRYGGPVISGMKPYPPYRGCSVRRVRTCPVPVRCVTTRTSAHMTALCGMACRSTPGTPIPRRRRSSGGHMGRGDACVAPTYGQDDP
jgi:hypothetical protein